jgi:hypothetical protein
MRKPEMEARRGGIGDEEERAHVLKLEAKRGGAMGGIAHMGEIDRKRILQRILQERKGGDGERSSGLFFFLSSSSFSAAYW